MATRATFKSALKLPKTGISRSTMPTQGSIGGLGKTATRQGMGAPMMPKAGGGSYPSNAPPMRRPPMQPAPTPPAEDKVGMSPGSDRTTAQRAGAPPKGPDTRANGNFNLMLGQSKGSGGMRGRR